jgi:hypothetical protein
MSGNPSHHWTSSQEPHSLRRKEILSKYQAQVGYAAFRLVNYLWITPKYRYLPPEAPVTSMCRCSTAVFSMPPILFTD